MAVHVYALETESKLQQCGFRWCTKDQRWERKGGLKPGDKEAIAKIVPGATVETKG